MKDELRWGQVEKACRRCGKIFFLKVARPCYKKPKPEMKNFKIRPQDATVTRHIERQQCQEICQD
jgi:hypothetical protein